MAQEVARMGFGGAYVYYVTLLGFTWNPVITVGDGTLVTLPKRTLKVTLKPGGRNR